MRHSISSRSFGSGYGSFFPRGVKWLLISNFAIFVIYFFAAAFSPALYSLFDPLGLRPSDVVRHFAIWQLVTYMFLHDPFGFSHVLFNMLTLWMFGRTLEETWGTRRFLKYYFLCGIGAGICVIVANLLFSDTLGARTIGASGAIYGLLLAFGMLFPEVEILFSFLFPIKAKYFVMIFGAIAFMSSLASPGGGVSHVAHLGGMIFGFFYIRTQRRRKGGGDFDPFGAAQRWYREWKLQRARRKFQVYLKKRETDHDRWVH